ncbi:DNA polymerase II large subunit [Candidatus Micrarchaeota archaeon]|nr:DNA polymerase II large subunit [Candidatus Micrarchaeota archaeon]
MVEASPRVQKYFESMKNEIDSQIALANQARSKNLDAANEVEVAPARDVAARVEGLVGPKGVAERIRELNLELGDREKVCFEIAKEIMQGKFIQGTKQELIEQAVRSALALFTEGVVSAPIEGVSKIELKKNHDGSEYVAVYFTGPIRGAGGTGQAFTLLIADYCRKFFDLSPYLPLEDEKNRYVEELNLYAIKTRAGQYVPTEEEVKHVVSNCAVCVHGEPTEDYEVSTYKNLPSIETNKVRSGVCLVISEGVCLKAAKVMKIAKKAGLDWTWLEKLVKVSKQSEKKTEIKPVTKYMDEIVAGRPIFSFPMKPGGFRLRYGRTRFCGILSKAIHPATMIILDEFAVFGTQVKTERPGKGCIVTSCETIEGPTVLMDDGEVKQITTVEEALEAKSSIKEILFLGDMLACFGDFNKSNHPIIQAAWCEEWLQRELEAKGIKKTIKEIQDLSFKEAFELTKHAPLAPKYTFYLHDLTVKELKQLAHYLTEQGKLEYEWFDFKGFKLKKTSDKRLLELIALPHKTQGDEIIIQEDYALALLHSLNLIQDKKLTTAKIDSLSDEKTTTEVLAELAPFLRKKAGNYLGTSMGRPEKSKERKMQPPVNTLFPIGQAGGKTRDVIKAMREGVIEVEVENRECVSCKTKQWTKKCICGGSTRRIEQCTKCGKESCSCNAKKIKSSLQRINLKELVDKASAKVQSKPDKVKAVIGLISGAKTPEPIEKGLLRAKHELNVFRDGTIRHDSTEVPITHFIPFEIGASIEELKELGYEKDCYGNEITRDDQIIELLPQDIIVSEHALEYFYRVTQFIDDELVYLYGLHSYFNCNKPSDLIGKTFVAIAPHTSAGIACRLIGFTSVQGLLAHPYLHCACRRNADGDELAIMLAMDLFLNFSKEYLPETRGGKMDAALVLTTVLDPREVDDEVHAMDRSFEYPLEFYSNAENNYAPSEAKIRIIGQDLGTPAQYEGIGFTHESRILGPVISSYVSLKTMADKVESELELMRKIRAVDEGKASEKIILSHFLPDLYGNLRSFGRQKIRCVECNAKYRRVPLSGKCRKCGGKLLLTINKGGILKYLEISKSMIEKYSLPDYLKQRLMLLEREINEIFKEEDSKQFSLAKYF